jgi:catechol 2,3-dioxygenase-like lactoylglutathione lyase family enzyme
MMTPTSIDHVNLSVSEPEHSAEMFSALFGWHIRWRGRSASGGRTIHAGSDVHYIAVHQSADADGSPCGHAKGRPLNHVGFVVDDLNDIERRAIAFGLVPFNHDDYEPGRRFYFFDRNGIEYEIVSYSKGAAA